MPEPARVTTTDAEIDGALQQARVFERYDHPVAAVKYLKDLDAISMRFEHGVTYNIPRRAIQGLREASDSDLGSIEILGNGSGLYWPSLDVAHSVEGLLKGLFGSPSWMKLIGD